MNNPDLIDLVADQLRAQGFNGLFNEYGGCACKLDDLAPCLEPGMKCEAGYYKAGCTDYCDAPNRGEKPMTRYHWVRRRRLTTMTPVCALLAPETRERP